MSIPSQDTWAHDDDVHGGESDGTNESTHSKLRLRLDRQPVANSPSSSMELEGGTMNSPETRTSFAHHRAGRDSSCSIFPRTFFCVVINITKRRRSGVPWSCHAMEIFCTGEQWDQQLSVSSLKNGRNRHIGLEAFAQRAWRV